MAGIDVGQRFGDTSQIEVIERIAKDTYRVRCDICRKDSELFEGGVFDVLGCNLKRGSVPCGCARNHSWTRKQYDIKIERKCAEKNLTYVGLSETWRGTPTRLDLKCNTCNNQWATTNISSLLTMGTSCKTCIRKSKEEDFEKYLEKLILEGNFPQGTKITYKTKKEAPSNSICDYYCPLCSEDEYVAEGLCTGQFTSVSGELHRGSRPCRCSRSYKWTKAQQEYRISKKLKNYPNIIFMGWTGGYKNKNSKIDLFCNIHKSTHTPSVSNFIHSGNMCPICNTNGFRREKPANVYVIYVKGPEYDFVGYGISNYLDARLKTHIKNIQNSGYEIVFGKSFLTTGEKALEIETQIKRKFECFNQKIEGFIKEATFAKYYSEILNYIEKRLYD